MSPDEVLSTLLVVSLGLAILLTGIALAALGRKLADLEFQIVRGIVGVPRIQSGITIRSQIGNVGIGMLFILITVLLLAGAPEWIRMWANRGFWTVLLGGLLASEVMDWMAERKQIRLLITDQAGALNVYKAMAEEAVANLEASAAVHSAYAPIPPLAAVLPEHSSPTTAQQRETAEIATMRARLVAANLALGLEPEPAKERDEDEERKRS